MNNLFSAVISLFCLQLFCANTSHAYLDPGTGSMLLQALAAVVIGIGFFWRRILDTVRSFFSKKDKKES